MFSRACAEPGRNFRLVACRGALLRVWPQSLVHGRVRREIGGRGIELVDKVLANALVLVLVFPVEDPCQRPVALTSPCPTASAAASIASVRRAIRRSA